MPVDNSRRRFDYNQYVNEIHQKLGSDSQFKTKSFNNYIANEIDHFRKDLSNNNNGQNGYPTSGNEDPSTNQNLSMSQINAYKSASQMRQGPPGRGYQSDNSNSLINSHLSAGGAGAQNFREKLMARLGNAQLSDSKQYDSYGVEEEDNEESKNGSQIYQEDGGESQYSQNE